MACCSLQRSMPLLLLAALVLLTCHADTAASSPRQQLKLQLPPVDPESKLFSRMAGLVVPHGYPLEEHFVETVDGYILRMFRIPHGRNEPPPSQQRQQQHTAAAAAAASKLTTSRRLQTASSGASSSSSSSSSSSGSASQAVVRPVVHIQHGLLGSSTDFVLNAPHNSLPMMLADAGFDVWFGNVRGNVFSRNHTVLDVLDADFWSFSWDEMASRDLPAMFTHELMVTGAPHISYVGHSQGTTIIMAFLATHADSALAQHIKVAILLAPVAYVTHMDSLPMNALAALDTDEIFTLLGFHEFMPSSEILSKLEGQMCKSQPWLCVNLLSLLCGYNPDNLDSSMLPTYLNYTPSGTSVANLAHWSQSVRSQRPDVVTMFDYGSECRTYFDLPKACNQVVYGQPTPPVYNFLNIKAPLVVFTGGQDILADPTDTVILLRHLPKVLAHHHEPKYGHLDFIWGYNAAEKVYKKVLQTLVDGRPQS